MTIVSFQGTGLTSKQRLMLSQQQHVRQSFINPVLAEQVSATLAVMDARKEQGVKPERIWFPDYEKSGTISVAEWMGY